MKMYLENGYVNMKDLLKNEFPFLFVVGGRGTGKTYGTLKSILELQNDGCINRFLYIRRSQKEVDLLSSDATNPFKKVNEDLEINVKVEPVRMGLYAFKLNDDIIGYSAGLSTFHNLRGFDFSDVSLILWDEFIPEKTARPIPHEAETLFQLYESVNRNRELQGTEAVKLVALANSNQLANPIFMELNIINSLEKIVLKGGGTYRDKERGLMVVILSESPISAKKKKTALYKLVGKGDFAEMALSNDFADNDRDFIKPQNLSEYNPLTSIGGIAIWRHKSNQLYYACQKEGACEFKTTEHDLKTYKLRYYYLINRYYDGSLLFSDILTKTLFLWYNGLK